MAVSVGLADRFGPCLHDRARIWHRSGRWDQPRTAGTDSHETLSDIAQVIRSKNAGPRRPTLDVMFGSDADYQRVAQSPALSAEAVGRLYGAVAEAVTVILYPAGRAIKIVTARHVSRPVILGDVDVHGAQQHAPLLGIESMSASGRILTEVRRARRPLRLMGASGQLGYGIPTRLQCGPWVKWPDLIGCDMGSIDIGPTYLGKGEMATAPEATRRDLRKVLLAARELDVPLVIGSAGSAGAAPHLDATLALLRDIARTDGLRFRMAVMRADVRRGRCCWKHFAMDGSSALTTCRH